MNISEKKRETAWSSKNKEQYKKMKRYKRRMMTNQWREDDKMTM